MAVTWEDEGVYVGHVVYILSSVFVCFDELQPFLRLFNILLSSGQTQTLTVLFVGWYLNLIYRKRIKKLAVCCRNQGLFIMCLLPLFKSLMQEGHSHMTERDREGAYVFCVEEWRSLYCYVQTKVSTATTCTISPLIKTQGWSASITPHSHARTHICAHRHF